MTWSIIASDSSTGRIGIAVATRFFAVGAPGAAQVAASTAIGSREPGFESLRGHHSHRQLNLFERRKNALSQVGAFSAKARQKDDGIVVRDPGQGFDDAR